MYLVKLDDVILDELRSSPSTEAEIGERILKRLYPTLRRLFREEKIIRGGPEGKGNVKVYALPPIKRRGPIPQNYANGSSS
jgi:hypothetical protein